MTFSFGNGNGASVNYFPSTPKVVAAPLAPVPPQAKQKQKDRVKGPSFRNPAELVTLEIGSDKTKFVVHKEFACHYSPTLKAAFNSEFIEGQTQTYTEEDPGKDAGRLLVHWFYAQDLTILDREDWGLHETDEENLALIQLWILAEKLLIPQLQNLVLRAMNKTQGVAGVSSRNIRYVYDHTDKGSLLRKYIVHRCACFVDPERYEEESQSFPQEMLLELAAAFASKLGGRSVAQAFGMEANWGEYEAPMPKSS